MVLCPVCHSLNVFLYINVLCGYMSSEDCAVRNLVGFIFSKFKNGISSAYCKQTECIRVGVEGYPHTDIV